MTTPGNGGADSTQGTPAEDDVFGYLYADGQAAGATPPPGGGGYGYPGSRSSYGQVRTVGERQYGQPQQAAGQQAYGQMPPHAPAPQQTSTHYAAPETLPGAGAPGGPAGARSARRGNGGGRGPNTKGLLIGALAVVAAVVVGIGIAVATSDKDEPKNAGGDPTPGVSQEQPGDGTVNQGGDGKNGEDKPAPAALPREDAKALTLAGGATVSGDVKGAKASGGTYVAGLNQVGASATWAVDDIAKAKTYKLYVRYSIPGEGADATLVVNGKPNTTPLGLKQFIDSPKGDWEKGWQSTWAPVDLKKGTNTIQIACAEGNQCNALLDQVWLEKN